MFSKHISNEATDRLMAYLLSHEVDIAWEYEDFGELREIFVELLDREPKKENYGV